MLGWAIDIRGMTAGRKLSHEPAAQYVSRTHLVFETHVNMIRQIGNDWTRPYMSSERIGYIFENESDYLCSPSPSRSRSRSPAPAPVTLSSSFPVLQASMDHVRRTRHHHHYHQLRSRFHGIPPPPPLHPYALPSASPRLVPFTNTPATTRLHSNPAESSQGRP